MFDEWPPAAAAAAVKIGGLSSQDLLKCSGEKMRLSCCWCNKTGVTDVSTSEDNNL